MKTLKMFRGLPQVFISVLVISSTVFLQGRWAPAADAPAAAASPDVRLAGIFANGMVLQHGQEVPIWGWAGAGDKVTVTLEGKSYDAVADKDGQWMVRLAAHKPSSDPVEITVAGKNTITLKDVLFGDVWVCAGQSNMGWGVCGPGMPEEIAKINYPTIRQYFYWRVPAFKPDRDPVNHGNWRSADPKNVGEFCGVGFWFARRVQRDIKIPIGLIQTAYGSSSGETWAPAEAFRNDPDFAPMFDRAKDVSPETLAEETRIYREYKAQMAKWEVDAKAAKEKGTTEPSKLKDPPEKVAYAMRHTPGYCWDGIIAQIVPYRIQGVLWYQGESNSDRAFQYRKVMPIIIEQWRKQWNQGDFPFLLVQIANLGGAPSEECNSSFAELREAQAMTAAKVKNCYYGVSFDTGEYNNNYDVHPINKWDTGERMGLVALAKVYGKEVEYLGPVMESAKFEDGKAVLTFSHVEGGFRLGRDGSEKEARGFALAGEDKKFAWAQAKIDGNKIILTSANVPKPVAVRYAWNGNPRVNLYNQAGLPAAQFRTDDWPGITVNSK
jgi:sialate O-acetylesterase